MVSRTCKHDKWVRLTSLFNFFYLIRDFRDSSPNGPFCFIYRHTKPVKSVRGRYKTNLKALKSNKILKRQRIWYATGYIFQQQILKSMKNEESDEHFFLFNKSKLEH
jgi:hypothetical protein